ncbi:AbrB/MazE/SpoVT family DNA-binding domain-containing protein [Halobacteria archaeon HArc-gm2]|nr:AbrB/MazE/SpoVT family DNA-binding domain-containing protein [Halobacteria archaeon HArc-gm2]
MTGSSNEPTASVACDGTVTIPRRVRDTLGLEGTGRITFVETDDVEVVLRRVKPPAEIRGALATSADLDDEKCPSVTLREERRRDSAHVAEKLGNDGA